MFLKAACVNGKFKLKLNAVHWSIKIGKKNSNLTFTPGLFLELLAGHRI